MNHTNLVSNQSSMMPMSASLEEDDGIDLHQYWSTVRYHKWLVIGITVSVITAASVMVSQMPPLFTAETTILIEPRKIKTGLEELLTDMPFKDDVVSTELEVLRSRPVIKKAVEQLNLAQDPEFNAALRDQPPWKAMLNLLNWVPEEWRHAIFGSPAEVSEAEIERYSHIAVINTVRGRMDAGQVGRAMVIKLAFTSENPDKAAKIANALVGAFFEHQREIHSSEIGRMTGWLEDRLSSLREDVIAAEREVALYKAEHGLFGAGQITVAGQQLGELNSAYVLAKSDRAQAEAHLREVEKLLKNRGEVSAAKVLDSVLIQNLLTQEAAVARKAAELSSRYGSRHPKMIDAVAEQEEIKRKIGREVSKVVQRLRNEVDVARAREANLRQGLGQLEQDRKSQGHAEVKLHELEREAEAVRVLYETFLDRFKLASQQQQLNMTDARVIAPAEVPLGPSKPRKKVILGMSGIFSLLGSIILAFFIETLRRGFRSEDQLALWTGIQDIYSLPEVSTKGRQVVDYFLEFPLSNFSEGVRHIRTAFREPIVLCTSCLPGEGKSTIALALARANALSGQRTLLMDLDLRKSSLQRYLPAKADHRHDVLALLEGKANWREVAIDDFEDTGLTIIPAFQRNNWSPADFLERADLHQLFANLRENFDRIIIDTPPVGLVTDTHLLMPYVDRIIYMVRYQTTAREMVMAQMGKFPMDKLGIVLNRVNLKHTDEYHKYGYGGYYLSS